MISGHSVGGGGGAHGGRNGASSLAGGRILTGVRHLIAAGLLAIVLLTAGAIFLVNRLTDYPASSRSAVERAASDPPASPLPPPDLSRQEPGDHDAIPAAREAPPPNIRTTRIREQMERVNQRNRERLGQRTGQAPPPPPPASEPSPKR